MKIKLKKVKKPTFFLKDGTVLIVDEKLGKVFTEDREQWCPVDLVDKCGAEFEILER